MALSDWVSNLSLGGLAGGLLSGIGYSNLMSDLSALGTEAGQGAADLASKAQAATEFRPFTVTSGTGGAMKAGYDPTTGQVNMTTSLSPQEQQLQNLLLGQAQTYFGNAGQDTTAMSQDYYNRMRALQSPEEQRQQLALENRLAAQGRLGVNTAQYGGTPEQLALSKAQEEAKNQAALAAMQQAQQYQQQQAALGQGALTTAYAPQSALQNLYGQGLQTASLADVGRRQGAGYMTDLGMAGLDAQLQAQLGRANLGAQSMGALAALLGGSQISGTGGSASGLFGDYTLGQLGTDIYDKIFGSN